MLSLKCLIVLFVLQYICQTTYCQPNLKFFRKDYKYIEDTKAFYKIHTLHRTWQDAKERCSMEGATLFYPDDDDEANVVINYWNETQPFSWVYIGISTPNVKQVFETVDGVPITDVYDRWGPGEPNDAGGVEGCVILRRDGTLNDDQCDKKYPFICKKSLSTLEWNVYCDIPDQGYEYVKKLGRCYKFHLTPMNWTDAFTVCNTEQSYLAVINSQDEADHLVDMTRKAPKDNVEGNYVRGAVHLGFQFKRNRWQTIIKNMPLPDSGYTNWGGGQPDGKGEEKCGSMFYNGHLNDICCDQSLFFICEHEIDLLRNSYVLRFGDVFTAKPHDGMK
ncbi:C-type mannose receptor 2-like isoform X1 [Vanessa atalanta]|uniref:C-type mannose receptor 2-like isoform X1 n=1 Tax=Vanessa atalanta TaxID=42275 RepID=UPI001FCDC221|nr:C-type mannose receptor 2-like isoform X1 [Vanessa atalanta]